MPYVERITKTGDTVEKDRYFTPEYKKRNSKKAARRLRQLLSGKLPRVKITISYEQQNDGEYYDEADEQIDDDY